MKATLISFLILATLFSTACNSNAQDKKAGPAVELLEPTAFWSSYEQVNENAFLLDCRTPEEVSRGALPGATNIDLRSADFENKVSELNKENPVYVYCQVGGRSAKAAEKLKDLGFTKVVDMKGGYQAYLKSN